MSVCHRYLTNRLSAYGQSAESTLRTARRLVGAVALILAIGAHASGLEADLCAAVIRVPSVGARVVADDLPGRVVLLIVNNFASDAKWNEFALRTSAEFVNAAPPGSLLPLLIGDKPELNAKAWSERFPGVPMAFVMQKDLAISGFRWGGGPRFVLFDADGKIISDMIIDGRDLAGNSRYQSKGILMKADDVRRIAEAGPGSPVKIGTYKECKMEADQLVECGLTSSPFAPIMKILRDKAKVGKKGASNEANQLLDGVKEHLARAMAIIQRHIADEPLLAVRLLQRALTQTANDELGKPFELLSKTLKANKSFQEGLKSAESFNAVMTTAADIYWGMGDPDAVRPKDKIVAIKQGLDLLVKKYPESRSAKAAAPLKLQWDKWVGKAIDPLPW